MTSSKPGGYVQAWDDQEEIEKRGDDVTSCGWCDWRPQWLQRFDTRRWLLVMLCCPAFMAYLIEDGMTNSAVTSIERRFQLRSRDVGILLSIYEATVILATLPAMYLGGRGNKPRWLAIGCFLEGAAALLFALPHFITDKYAYFSDSPSDSVTCAKQGGNSTSTAESCSDDSESTYKLSKYLIIFGASKVLAGFAAPTLNIGLIFLDESITTKQNGPYLATFYTLELLGTAFGFIFGGFFLNIYTDVVVPPGVTASPSDPGWVGAWWMGFVIAGFVNIIIAVPMSLFPRELPTTAEIKANKPVEAHKKSGSDPTVPSADGLPVSDANRGKVSTEFRSILNILKHLAVNPTFVFAVFAVTSEILAINAFSVFLPKIIENQFGVTASFATLLTGVAVIPGSVVGMYLGGWMMRRWKLKVPGLTKLCLITSAIVSLIFFAMLMHCPQARMAGITTSYHSNHTSSSFNITNACNGECGCSSEKYLPVCAEENNIGYFSPCHAGCEIDYQNGTYGECSCLAADLSPASSPVVEDGVCSSSCVLLPIFVVLMNLGLIGMFVPQVPFFNIILRSVAEHERAIAIGINSVVARALGSIPGPIMFGVIIDGTCLQWQETCGDRGACWIYDSESLAWRLTIVSVLCFVVSTICYVFALRFYEPALGSDAKNCSDTALNLDADEIFMKNGEHLPIPTHV